VYRDGLDASAAVHCPKMAHQQAPQADSSYCFALTRFCGACRLASISGCLASATPLADLAPPDLPPARLVHGSLDAKQDVLDVQVGVVVRVCGA